MSYKLMQNIKDELDKIAEKGLNTGNLETAYKLIDMLKDMENVEYWKCKEEYYNTVQEQMEGGYSEGDYSERRKRDSMGRYSRADGMMPDYDRGSSYARRGEHYVRGHYSRANGAGNDSYNEYMDSKQSYRNNKSEDCKRRMLAALEEHMDALTEELKGMSDDSECREEREVMKRYIDKLRNMM
ncbi:MAG TPA: hypothetical protein H9717_02120 [Candidatus Eisenbergiella merdipullorum]|uniref:Uncharacterized protein n=1 Tax=Candidatus Eisenbergiella merdipullorum TaxID=2838553 RepID=A0A9D2I570_9FIRM|nr:hypothetical protein [Candidatus Eisenbergiella merdipullorum]